ncbi:hypothetical protein ABPG72_003972 [Tetrahymena utriculariae]
MDQNVVSSLVWVKKGYAKVNPIEFEMNEQDVNEMKKDPLVKKNANRELGKEIEDENEFEDVDDDDEEESLPVFAQEIEMLKNENMVDQDGNPLGFDDMSEEEKEDFQIKPTDALIVAAKIEKEFSSLEVYVYEEDRNNLFVHHEIQLSAFPLCLEWLRVDPSSFDASVQKPGNFAIVGSFLPEIEVWNLDVLNIIEPTFTLGGEVQQSSKKVKKFKKPKQQLKPGSHADAVLALSINPFRHNVLASGSADNTVKIWDLGQQKNIFTYTHHTNKVQVVSWNKQEESILLSGGYDRKICMFDVKNPQNILSCKIQSDIESAIWDPTNSNQIIFSTEDGYVSCIDARKFNLDYLFHFQSHEKSTTSVSMSPKVGGMLATTSIDHSVKIWDTTQITNKRPKLVSQKNPQAGKLFCGSFNQDSPFIFGCGNSKGEIFIWDTTEDKNIVECFGSRVEAKYQPNINLCTKEGEKNYFTKEGRDEDDDEADEMEQENEDVV